MVEVMDGIDIDPFVLRLPNIRACFQPDPGYVLVEADLERADAQVCAWDAGCEDLKRAFQSGEDIHTENAYELYGKVPNVRALHSNGLSFRDNSKRWVHATDFAGGYRTIAIAISVPEDRVKRVSHWWTRIKHPEIGEWHRRIEWQLTQNRIAMVTNAFGFRRIYADPAAHNLLNQALAWICQCLETTHEVLTPDGWIAIKEVNHQSPIATWKNGKVSFEIPSAWHFGKVNKMILLNGVNCTVTRNHRVPYYNAGRSTIQTSMAEHLPKQARIPRTGIYDGGLIHWSKAYCDLVVAFQADGSCDRNAITFEFRKERKIKRLESILQELELKYSKNIVRRDSTVFYIPNGLDHVPSEYKEYGPWLLGLDAETLDEILSELEVWDGWRDPHGVLFYSQAKEQSVDWIATICHLRGKRARYYDEDRHRITVASNKGLCSSTNRISLDGEFNVGCPTVSSGYFMIRAGKEISVTGNSTVAIAINKAMLNVDCARDLIGRPRCCHCLKCKYDDPAAFNLLLQIHDSLLLQVREDLIDQDFMHDLRFAMQITIPYPDPLIIPIEIKTSEVSWGEMHKWKFA